MIFGGVVGRELFEAPCGHLWGAAPSHLAYVPILHLPPNILATQALLAAFDPLLKRADAGKVIGLTSSVGETPRAYWSAYASTKAAFDNLLESYAQEVEKVSKLRVAIVDPGATRTSMRAKAYPGEDPKTVKEPAVVAERILELVVNGYESGHRERVAETG